jgi:hypothetical protein
MVDGVGRGSDECSVRLNGLKVAKTEACCLEGDQTVGEGDGGDAA